MIEVGGLSYAYPRAGREAIKGIDFRVERGEIFGFLGPSGAGKSTTQKILLGLLKGYRGSARMAGLEAKSGGRRLKEGIGVAFETPAFFLKLTALENLDYFSALYPGRPRDPRGLLDRLGLGAAAGKRVASFSKGMRTRLNLARALLHSPGILLLDEPTSGLDPANARVAAELVRERAKAGAAVFVTTHSMRLAEELCDRVAFLVDGRIAASGPPRELMLRHGRRSLVAEFRVPPASRGAAEGAAGQGGEAGPALERREFPLDGLGRDQDFLDLLRRGGIETLHTAEASLAEVFIALTGRGLE